MKFIKSCSKILNLPVIPSVVEIIADEIRKAINDAVIRHPVNIRLNDETAAVQLSSHGDQLLDRSIRIFCFHSDRDFVLNTPAIDGAVIIRLLDQALQLVNSVSAFQIFRGRNTDVRYFSPYQKPIPVTQAVEIVIMLIVRKSNTIGAYFSDDIHIQIHMLFGDCIAYASKVLMSAHTIDFNWLSIQNNPAFGRQLDRSKANFNLT
ncbi:hypothetical protein D3C85_1214690 [compost metagenome]